MAPNKLGITTTRSLYKFLVRETQKLPKDASKFYRESIRHGYEQVCHQWILNIFTSVQRTLIFIRNLIILDILKCFAGTKEDATSLDCPGEMNLCGVMTYDKTITATCTSEEVIFNGFGFSGTITDELKCVTKQTSSNDIEYCFCNTNNCNYLRKKWHNIMNGNE